MKKDFYLTRMDYDSCKGIMLRIPLSDSLALQYGVDVHRVFFGYKKHDCSWLKAKKAARLYRDEFIASDETLVLTCVRGEFSLSNAKARGCELSSSSTVSGVIGVVEYFRVLASGNFEHSWICTWMCKGVQRHSSRSVLRWGDEEAFLTACVLRAKKTGHLVVYKDVIRSGVTMINRIKSRLLKEGVDALVIVK